MGDQAAHGVEFVVAERGAQGLVEIAHLGLRLHPVSALLVRHDVVLGLVVVVLVLDVADDLFQHVLDGHQTGHAAVFVHHDGDVVARGAEFAQQHVEPLCFRDEHRRTQHVAQVHLLAGAQAQQVLGEEDADHVVAVVVDGGKAGVCGLDDEGQELFRRLLDVHHVHLRARDHDFAHLHLGHLHDALDHGKGVSVEQIVLVGRVEKL